MSLQIKTVRDNLKTLIDAVSGVRAYDTVPGNPATNSASDTAVIIRPATGRYIDYSQAFQGGLCRMDLELLILVPVSSMRAAQDRLDDLLSAGVGSTRSLFDAIRGSVPQTLSGACSDVMPTVARDVGSQVVNGVDYLEAYIDIVVYLPRS